MIYTFGPVRVDVEARDISTGAGPVHLTRKAWELLLLLLEARPAAVSKDQIHARLWPDTFVSDASVQSLIHEIRRAVDGPSGDSCIRTVHGLGYRFASEVQATESGTTRRSVAPAGWLTGGTIRLALAAGAQVIGRGVDDVLEIDEPTISRHHARITIADDATIEDLGSKNGTWVADTRVTGPRALPDGAIVRFGAVRLTFRRARQARPTESAAEPSRPDKPST